MLLLQQCGALPTGFNCHFVENYQLYAVTLKVLCTTYWFKNQPVLCRYYNSAVHYLLVFLPFCLKTYQITATLTRLCNTYWLP
jgi:hypothetical protein